jgi:hypothetical protein
MTSIAFAWEFELKKRFGNLKRKAISCATKNRKNVIFAPYAVQSPKLY